MPSQLSSGRWRTRVRHPRTHKQISTRLVIGGPETYATRQEAVAAEREAKRLLAANARIGVTVREWWEEWTTDPLWQRPAASTNVHYRERTEKFVQRYGDLGLRAVNDLTVAEWLQGGQNLGTVPKLRTMWNDAASVAAGRLVDRNPWDGLRLPRRPQRDRTPPKIEQILHLVGLADELTPPSFAAYLDVACHEGMRPGELDALRWSKIDFQAETIHVDEQWNAKTRTFSQPKHHHVRTIALTEPAKERLLRVPHESEFVFTTLLGTHYTPASRSWHWNRVRAAAGLGSMELYVATRHYFGWFAFNVLELTDKDVGLHLGHRDGGKLVRMTYGHPDEALARERVRDAYRRAPAAPIPLRKKRVR
jgi:integrase